MKKFLIEKISYTCEEGGARFRISFWHLLLNLKNNYLLSKLLKWTNKNVRILILKILYFFKKQRKAPGDIIILHMCTKILDSTVLDIWRVTE